MLDAHLPVRDNGRYCYSSFSLHLVLTFVGQRFPSEKAEFEPDRPSLRRTLYSVTIAFSSPSSSSSTSLLCPPSPAQKRSCLLSPPLRRPRLDHPFPQRIPLASASVLLQRNPSPTRHHRLTLPPLEPPSSHKAVAMADEKQRQSGEVNRSEASAGLLPTINPLAEKSEAAKPALHPAFYIATWIALSSSVILFNKWLLDTKGFKFREWLDPVGTTKVPTADANVAQQSSLRHGIWPLRP